LTSSQLEDPLPWALDTLAASATNGHSFKTARSCVILTRDDSPDPADDPGTAALRRGGGAPVPAWHGPCLWYGGAPPPVESPTACFGRRGGVLRPVGQASHDALPDRLPARGTPWPRPLVVAPRKNPGIPSNPGPVLGAAEISRIWSITSNPDWLPSKARSRLRTPLPPWLQGLAYSC